MNINTLFLSGFNAENPSVNYFLELKENTYIFNVKWNNYCDCAFLSIYDYYNNPIITGKALVNNLKIRNNKLPYVFYFTHINEETYEPTIDNISKDFVLAYTEEEENNNV